MLKSNISIANIRFFDNTPTVADLERRFSRFLRDFREQKCVAEQIERAAEGGPKENSDLYENSLSSQDKIKIERRALRDVERQEVAPGTQHLRTDDRNALRGLQNRATAMRVSNAHDADVLAATLQEEMPWMGPATGHIWHAMRQSVRESRPGIQFAPLLLLGPPGIGKSHWARRLDKLLEVPTTVVDATDGPASFALIGSLLSLLERMTAKTWQCPYYRMQFDLCWVGWVLTANCMRGLPEPLPVIRPAASVQTASDRVCAALGRGTQSS